MKKRVISLILTFAMVLSLFAIVPTFASAATTGECGDNLIYTYDNGTLTISGTGAMYEVHPFRGGFIVKI